MTDRETGFSESDVSAIPYHLTALAADSEVSYWDAASGDADDLLGGDDNAEPGENTFSGDLPVPASVYKSEVTDFVREEVRALVRSMSSRIAWRLNMRMVERRRGEDEDKLLGEITDRMIRLMEYHGLPVRREGD